MNRYERQTILPEVGEAGQARLSRARVLIVGAGGLAAPVLSYIVGAGVGHVTIIDHDRVDLSNLHRQTLFSHSDEGLPKVEQAARFCRGLNPDVVVESHFQALSPDNVETLIEEKDLVLDCADSYAVSYTLSDACFARRLPLISASALGFSGYVGGFCASAPSLRAVFPTAPTNSASCATAGVLGPVVGTLGALQAQMALHVLLGLEPKPLGLLINIDLGTFSMQRFRFDGASEPVGSMRFASLLDIRPDDFVVELRDEQEAPEPITPGSRRILPEAFVEGGPAPIPDQRVVLCCASGLRAWRVGESLRKYWSGEILLLAADSQNERRP